MKSSLAACLLLAISLPLPAAAAEPASAQERDIAAVRAAVILSGEAFNNRDPDAIMALYARDIVLVYPGAPDLGYAALAEAYSSLRQPANGVTVKTSPDIEEILVSGDLAVVRVTWNTTTTETEPARVSKRQMRDMQVWRRESDGKWKFARGMHFRVPPKEASPTP